MLECEKQPHADFFINLSLDIEDELDFEEEEPFDLTEYDQYYDWDEVEYMKLWFIAARHYVSRGHWDDAYEHISRSCPSDVSQHHETYNRNLEAWHYTNARVNELIQEATQALEAKSEQATQWPQFNHQGFS